jgi:hypothetical protein
VPSVLPNGIAVSHLTAEIPGRKKYLDVCVFHRFFTATLYNSIYDAQNAVLKEKKMYWNIIKLTLAMPVLLALLASQPASAVGYPFEFSTDAKMTYGSETAIEKVYGFMTVATDKNGDGTINVMFSNGSRSTSARFNARVKFLDQSGAVIREEYFDHWLGAAEFDEAIEGKVTKAMTSADFESIQVDFYLSDITGSNAAMANQVDY